jgi:CHAD domain-containing protein
MPAAVRKWIAAAPGAPAGEAARHILGVRLAEVDRALGRAARTSAGDPEAVHGLRVATRRASAALRLFAGLLPRRRARRLGERLKEVRRAANDARDDDVLLVHLGRDGAGDSLWLEELRAHRARAGGPIVAAFERLGRHGRFRRRTDKLLRRVGRHAPDADLPFGDWARASLRPVVARFFAADRSDGSDPSALHSFRIRGKELRYAMEVLAGAFPADFRGTLYPEVEALQTQLGEINDRVTALARLRDRLRDTGARRAACLRELLDRERGRLDGAMRHFRAWWAGRRQRLRRGFDELLGAAARPPRERPAVRVAAT